MMDPETGRRRSRWAVRALVALGVLSTIAATTAAGVDIAGHNAAASTPGPSTPTDTPSTGTAPTATPDYTPSVPQVLPRSGRSHTRSGGS